MANNKKHIVKHFRTSTNDYIIPQEYLEVGELSLNVNSESPMLMFKDNANNVQVLSPNKLSKNYEKVEYPTIDENVVFTSSEIGDNLDTVVNKLDSNVSLLVNETLKNEEVVAAAITKVKESIGLNENLNYITETTANYIQNASTLSEADLLLDAAIKNVTDSLSSLDGYATESYVTTQINALIDNAPGALDTLNELASALNDDANFATTVTNEIAKKADSAHTHTEYALISALNTANNTISTLQSTVTTLENKLNAIINAIGLNSDGTFSVPTSAQTSGYTTAATSVMSAIYLMDNQIEENETVTAYALTDLNNRLKQLEN